MTKTMNVGLIGAGNISDAYVRGLSLFEAVNLVAISDIDVPRANAKAQEHGIAKGYSVDDLFADDDVQMVINLTIPMVHAEVSLNALNAGKHVYSEKPLSVKREDAKQLVDTAAANKLGLGCAPDTFLGGGIQTCRKLIDQGVIGKPVAASAFMMRFGVEAWHPSPFSFFQYGGHPLFDMGPYYLNALVNLLGPIKSAVGLTQTGITERIIGSKPHAGTRLDIGAPIHNTALLETHAGQAITLIVSGEIIGSKLPNIEIYGDEGALVVPDPNTFGGPIYVKQKGQSDWQEVAVDSAYGYTTNVRGLGAADLAMSLQDDRPARAGANLAYHVVDTLQTIHEAAEARRYLDVQSTVERPARLPEGLKSGEVK
ncbi:MAG: Gfo/Idh/MocA family oxidoreductase [Deinococcota bacterium]